MKKMKLISIIAIPLAILVITGGLVLLRFRSTNDKSANTPPASEEIRQLTAEDFETVEVPNEVNQTKKVLIFSINTKDLNAMSVGSVEEYNSYPEPQIGDETDNFTFIIAESGKQVYKKSFSIPVSRAEEFADDGTIKIVGMSRAEKVTFATPRFANGSTITIRNKAGKVVLSDTIKNVKVHNNKPASYKTVIPKSEDVQGVEQRESRR